MQRTEPTLFVVDDDEAILKSLCTMGESVGMPVEVFTSAREFLDHYHPDHTGCLVLDVRMPDMNGLDLQEALNVRGIKLPVIFISGFPDVQLAVRALKAGAVDFLEKPFKLHILLDCISRAFECDAQNRESYAYQASCATCFGSLTPRERDVMQLLIIGNSGKQTATKLNISYKTMEKFRAKVMRKMHAKSMAELVLMAVNMGLISANDELKTAETATV